MITVKEAAAKLNGCIYTKEGSPELFMAMKESGLVAVFGASDDLMEFRGAVYEEIGAYNGTTVYLTPSGLLENECESDNCPYYEKLTENAATLEAIWDEPLAPSWSYKTVIPHETFIVKEDGEPYCEGIVFALADVPVRSKHNEV